MNYLNYLQLVIQIAVISENSYNDFKYECVKGTSCRKTRELINKQCNEWRPNGTMHLSLESCRLVCGLDSRLWPIPQKPFTLSKNYTAIDLRLLKFSLKSFLELETKEFLTNIIKLFKENVKAKCEGSCKATNQTVPIELYIEDPEVRLNWETDERYELLIFTKNNSATSNSTVIIKAQTVFGIRHGLETLAQLIVPGVTINSTTQLVMLNSAKIKDWPAVRHRGIHINSGRTFYPIDDILSIIDGMSACKMNVLHWQASDRNSFSFKINSVPQMSIYGSFAPKKVYSMKDMVTVVNYGRSRGVRVIIEIDVPSTSTGWDWGQKHGLGNLTTCRDQEIWGAPCLQYPPCGTLNPVNQNTYKVLKKIYTDLVNIFGRDGVVHLGGREVYITCWNATEEILAEMAQKGLGRTLDDFKQVWSSFHNKQLDILNEVSDEYAPTESAIIWSSSLTTSGDVGELLDKCKFIIQTDEAGDYDKYLRDDFKVILYVNSTLLDKCSFIESAAKLTWWKDIYDIEVAKKPGVLGYELTEFIDLSKFSTKVIALSERLWSNPEPSETSKALRRVAKQVARLRQRNILTDFEQPDWCEQHESVCWQAAANQSQRAAHTY